MRHAARWAVVGLMFLAAGCEWCCPSKSAGPGGPATRPAGEVVIDVRTEAEYDAGHVAGAVLIPHDTIGEKIGQHVKDKARPIVVYCRSGRRAGAALKTLKQMGYTNARSGGGLADMIDAGYKKAN